MALIDEKCRKLLMLKYNSGLSCMKEICTDHLDRDLHPVSSDILNQQLYKEAITLVKNQYDLIPLTFLDRRKIAALSIGDTTITTFQKTLGNYAPVDFFNLPSSFSSDLADSIHRLLASYNLLIIGIHNTSNNPAKKYGISDEALVLIDTCSISGKTVLDVFGSPYSLGLIKNPSNLDAILVSYEDNVVSQKLSAEILFGGLAAKGQLPVTAFPVFPLRSGLESNKKRFEYVFPEEIGIPSSSLKKIDSIAMKGIRNKSLSRMPGIICEGEEKYFTSNRSAIQFMETVSWLRMMIFMTLPPLQRLHQQHLPSMKLLRRRKIHLDDPLVRYLPGVKGSNKENLTIREIMTHQAGLQPWIRFYEKTMKNGSLDPTVYQSSHSLDFPDRVAENIYIQKNWHDSIYQAIINSPLREVKDYKYSDLGFYLLRLVIRKDHRTTLDCLHG